MSTTTTAPPRQLLSFALSGEEYAIDVLRVREIITYDTLTRVPAMPTCVRGVINLRGRVVPVVDLAVRFGMPECDITARTSVVVVELASSNGAFVLGILTDAVSEVFDLHADRVQPAPTLGTVVAAEFLDGMVETSSRKFVMLLNIDRALGADAFAHMTS